MKTKETNFSQENDQKKSRIINSTKIAPKSARPVKSMVKLQSLKPKRMGIAKKVSLKKA